MSAIAGQKSALGWAVNISVVGLVLLWLFPTLGLFVSSFRTGDQITASGWWSALFPAEQTLQIRALDPGDNRVELGDGIYAVRGNVFADRDAPLDVLSWGTSSRRL